jgi:hypothetical protein
MTGLEVVVALERLHQHRREPADRDRRHEHERDREIFGDERPVGRGGRVDDLVHAALAVAPDGSPA